MAIHDPAGIVLLTHHPLGLRVELSFEHEGLLEIWISPKPATSADYWDRNFSNRDDHTRLFDRIRLHGLSRERFRGCDYDPFHVVARFDGQVLHLVPLLGLPALALWAEAPLTVDFKSDKTDAPLPPAPHRFTLLHPDRGYSFEFGAAVRTGLEAFRHHLHFDRGRSFYSLASLPPDTALVVGGGLVGESIPDRLQAYAERSPERLLADNEAALRSDLAAGTLQLRDQPDLQRLIDRNRRVLLAMQDPAGAIRAALNRIYYMIWVRDGAIIEAFQAYAGRTAEIARWADFLLHNPTRIDDPRAPGTTWTMLVNPLTKWEEDGVFYALWSAFTAWTQTGDDRFVRGPNLALLTSAMDWLERYCFDPERGLFGRYFACETPFEGSRDAGYDHAIGLPTAWPPFRYQGRPVRRSYDLYINQLAYASYRILAAIHGPGPEGRACLTRAAALADRMQPWLTGPAPDYGDLLLDDGAVVRAPAREVDLTDWVWGLSVVPFFSSGYARHACRAAVLSEELAHPRNHFLAGWFSLLASTDPLYTPEADVRAAIDRAAARCHRPGRLLAMPDTVVEMLATEDGDLWHDVRPQAFSIGPWLATLSGRLLHRLPFGLAVRPTSLVRSLPDYRWRDHRLSVVTEGEGPAIASWTLDGQVVEGTWQVPEDRLRESSRLVVRLGPSAPPAACWLESSLSLRDLQRTPDGWRATALGHGRNEWVIRGVRPGSCTVRDQRGAPLPLEERLHGADGEFACDAWGPLVIEYHSVP